MTKSQYPRRMIRANHEINPFMFKFITAASVMAASIELLSPILSRVMGA